MRYRITKSFFNGAREMREQFARQFRDPRAIHSGRFVWDFWHIEDQYSVLRTPASAFFPPELYQRFHKALSLHAQTKWGCAQISAPWLSYYVDGCYQGLHADVPQGPWAYVYSLTDWSNRNFQGGETMLLKDEVLDYWNSEVWFKGRESKDMFEFIPARWNQLLVFDPKIPHAVREIQGSRDPVQGRLVIHGWFMNPCPYVTGGLQKNRSLSRILKKMGAEIFSESVDVVGFLSLELRILPSGRVGGARILTESLRSRSSGVYEKLRFLRSVKKNVLQLRFPSDARPSKLVLPISFEAS
jgi:hypothetical protein